MKNDVDKEIESLKTIEALKLKYDEVSTSKNQWGTILVTVSLSILGLYIYNYGRLSESSTFVEYSPHVNITLLVFSGITIYALYRKYIRKPSKTLREIREKIDLIASKNIQEDNNFRY
jgi:hypothetical protein